MDVLDRHDVCSKIMFEGRVWNNATPTAKVS
jgi:hypothetical protein